MPDTRLVEILQATTRCYRKGPEIEIRRDGAIEVVEIWAMPHVDECPADEERVDVHFLVVGVKRSTAAASRTEVVKLLAAHPSLERGVSYIELGAELGDQELALRLFALGTFLGLWEIVTPETFGFRGHEAAHLAGCGLVMIRPRELN